MKLAEALSLRADLQRRIAALRERLKKNARVQEGDTPAEDPMELLAELSADTDDLEGLMVFNDPATTETYTVWEDSRLSLTELIARRDALGLKISVMRDFLDEAATKVDRYSSKEIRLLSTVPVAELQKQVDALSRELRLLDVELQRMNWSTELR